MARTPEGGSDGKAPVRQGSVDLREAYDRANKLSGLSKGRVFKATVTPNWFANSTRFWYKNDLAGGTKEFIVVDAERGTREPAFDHKKLAAGLAKASETNVDPSKLPFDVIRFVDEARAVEFTVSGATYQCNLAKYECTKLKKADPKPPVKDKEPAKDKEPVKEKETPTFEGGPFDDETEEPFVEPQVGDPKKFQPPSLRELRSPDGKWTALIKDSNVYLRWNASGQETQLTTEGTEKDGFLGFTWAPNSSRFASFKTTSIEPGKAFILDSSPKGMIRSKVTEWAYRLPGDKLEHRDLWLFDVDPIKPHRVVTEPFDFGPIPLTWRPDGKSFTYLRTYRGHQRCTLTEVDAVTGTARAIIDEKCDTRIVRAKQYMQILDATQEVIWLSERDGWNHLYLIDARSGAVKTQITRGDWVVRKVERVDEKARQIWFSASGRNLDQDPYFIHYYRVNFDGSGLIALTEGNGNHTISYSPDNKYLLDSYSRVDLPPVTNLRRVSDGSLVCELERCDISAFRAAGWHAPEVFTAKARDGKTDIWGVAYLPSNFDPKVKYPVIEYIYAGPWTSTAPKTFLTFSSRQQLAELGFVVVIIDGMGTPNRSRAFHDVSHKNNGDCGLPDRILWIKALARKYPNLDLSRVGIYGHSGGGYSSLRALLTHGDFYKVAVSSGGNHDPRTYNYGYTEQWMGWPVSDHYVDQSNVTHAHKLEGKLLLIHGEVDNNVVPSMTTMRVADSLIKSNKDFDLLIMPGRAHALQGPYLTRRTWDYFVRHLLGMEPPPANLFPQKTNFD